MMISYKSSQSPNWRLLQNTLYQVCYVLSRPLNANMIYWAWATEGETRLYLYQRSKTEWSDANAMRCDAIRCLRKWVNETKWKQNKLHVSDEEKQKNRQTKQKRTYKTIMTSRTKYPICADLTEQTEWSKNCGQANDIRHAETPNIQEEGKRIAIIFGGREFVCASQASKRTIKD